MLIKASPDAGDLEDHGAIDGGRRLLEAAASGLGSNATASEFAGLIADSLRQRELLCAACRHGRVLERNISLGYARTFKVCAAGHTVRLARICGQAYPGLDAAARAHYAGAVVVTCRGYGHMRGGRAGHRRVGFPPAGERFRRDPTDGLAIHLRGLLAADK
jgi:hypothetical protein